MSRSKHSVALATYNLAAIENASQRTRQPDTSLVADVFSLETVQPSRESVQSAGNAHVSDTWEPARRERAARLGSVYVPPMDANCTQRVYSSTQSIYELRTDSELARICGIGLKQYHLFQRWVVLHHLTRETGKQGFTRAEFDATMQHYNIKGVDVYNSRLLKRGHGFYWQFVNGMVYPTGYVTLCQRVIAYAHERGLDDLYLYGNHPGQRRDMYINVNGSGGDFEAQILASWYALHNSPTISRYSLEILLHRDSRSIRRMERRAGIRITFNEAQTTDPAAVPLNADGTLRGDVVPHGGLWTWRLPNTYTAGAVRQHPRRGQGRKVACWFKHWLDTRLPGSHEAGNGNVSGKLNSVSRTYCETDKVLKASRRRGNDGVLYRVTMRQRKGRVWDVDSGATHAI